MTAPAPSLRRATPADAAVALSWTPTEAGLRRWVGPHTRWPTTPETFWPEISSPDATTFAFIAPAGDLVGFGQVRHREQVYGHLARLIVSPRRRGEGLGRALCLALMSEAPRLHPTIKAYSLYVYPDNVNAHGLYRSLGFQDRGMHPEHHCMLMEAPLDAIARPDITAPGTARDPR